MKRTLVFIGTMLMVLGLAGCNSSDPESNVTLTVLHASPDAPTVNVKFDGRTVAQDADYGQAVEIRTPGGSYPIQVDANLPGGQTSTVIGPTTLDLADNNHYSVIAVGKVADSSLTALVLQDKGPPADSSKVRVTVAHLAPNAPSVDVYVTAPGTALSSASPLGTLSFKQSLGPVDIPAGNYVVRLTAAGTTTVAYDSGPVSLPAGRNLLVGALTNVGHGTSPVTLAVVDGGSVTPVPDVNANAGVRVVHDITALGPVNVFVNGQTPAAISNLSFPNAAPGAGNTQADYASLAAGTTQFAVSTGTDPSTAPLKFSANLVNGDAYTAIAYSDQGTPKALVVQDNNRAVATGSKLRIIHGAESAGNVDVYLVPHGQGIGNSQPVLTDVPYTANSGYLYVSAGDYDVIITPTGTGTAAIGPVQVQLQADKVYTAIAREGNTTTGDTFGLITLDGFH